MQVLAAVDAERLAGDERRAIADEEYNGARDLSRPRESPNGDPGHDLLEDLLGHRRDHRGIGVPGRYDIDGDAAGCALERQRLGEADHAGLGGGVVGLAELSGQRIDRTISAIPPPAAVVVKGCPIHSMASGLIGESVQMGNVTRTALSFGTSATLALAAGENSDDLQFVAGVRAWF